MAPKSKKHREDQLDEALAESFPTSDPPEMTDPMVSVRARTVRSRKRKKQVAGKTSAGKKPPSRMKRRVKTASKRKQ